MEAIRGFQGQYEFLSNFCIRKMDMTISGLPLRLCSSEAAYHMFKLFRDWRNPTQEELVRAQEFALTAITPGRAKRLGRRIPIDIGYWESVRDDVMYFVLTAKFSDPELRRNLLATGDAYLEETNTWNDTYWGVCGGIGKNRLGELLMKLRASLAGPGGEA